MIELNELKLLWGELLGKIPSDQQWTFWGLMHTPTAIHRAILKTTQKNLSVGGTMSEDHKLRFASKVMLTGSAQRKENAANKERLRQEFEGQVQR
jgi:hypothetical protein